MMIRRCFLLLALAACMLVSCSSQDNEGIAEELFVSSISLDNEPVKISDGNLSVKLMFNNDLSQYSLNKQYISINDALISSVTVDRMYLTINISSLKDDSEYDLALGSGVFSDGKGVVSEEYSHHFATAKAVTLSTSLVTENPIPQAQKLFSYMNDIYGVKILSSTMADVNWNIDEAELLNTTLGKYPAIATFDYVHLYASPANWIDYSNIEVVDKWWNGGGIVSAGWHWNVPTKDGSQDYSYRPGDGSKNSDGEWTTTFKVGNISNENSWERKVVDNDLDKISSYILLLQNKGIPVIWRPLHEAAGNIYVYNNGTAWFWWGSDGAQAYKKLWIYMFDFFKKKGVRNLIWVWTSQLKDKDFYPGDDYVDIIGRDIYDLKDSKEISNQFNELKEEYSNKMITLSECGNVDNISTQWSNGAKWLYFMPWYSYKVTNLDEHFYANTSWWKNVLQQNYVVTKDQLPSFK